jgi:hypothetical protein
MSQLQSETVTVSAPMSFSGSARRISLALWGRRGVPGKALVGWWAVPTLIATAWFLVVCWYLVFGLLLAPYRLVRRGSRKRKRDEARHREMLNAQSSQSP